MYARNVSISLKPNTAPEFTQTFEKDILPMLRKQNGFKDEITFVSASGKEAFAISLWDRKESADQYGRDTYPQVLKGLTPGQTVVLHPPDTLMDGARVTVRAN